MVKLAPIPTDAGDADYRPAINNLGWAVWHARQLGFGVPTHIEAALLILKEEAPVYFFSTIGRDPTILCLSAKGGQDLEDQIELLGVIKAQMERRQKRQQEGAARAVGTFARATADLSSDSGSRRDGEDPRSGAEAEGRQNGSRSEIARDLPA